MASKRIIRLTAAVVWTALTTPCLAIASPQQPVVTVAQPAYSTPAGDLTVTLPALQQTASAAIGNPFANPFTAFGESTAGEDPDPAHGGPVADGVPVAYPAAGPAPHSSSAWKPTHFEVFGDAQWRNLTSSNGFSSSYCLPSGCITNSGSLKSDLGLGAWGVGPHIGFIWTPSKEILGATSKIWVEWGQLNRSDTRTLVASVTFLGVTYVAAATLQGELNNRAFTIGYAPRWGNDKFRIGPAFWYQRLTVDFILNNLTTGAPPPVHLEQDFPNNVGMIGADYDYMPVHDFDLFGRAGWVPCCGGGYHGNETEFGAKYYFLHNLSIMGGIRYYWLKRDFSAPATTYTVGDQSVTLGPFSGFIKFPGVGPFIGASYRF
jgi:hypothetical protein